MFSTLASRPRLIRSRSLAFEHLTERALFCASMSVEVPSPTEGVELAHVVHAENNYNFAPNTEHASQIPPLVFQFGDLSPGVYNFSFEITLDLGGVVELPAGGEPAPMPTPSTPEPEQTPLEDPSAETLPALLAASGGELFYDDFDGAGVANFWTEYTPLTPVQWVADAADPTDKALEVTHAEDESRIVLRKELPDLERVYVSFEETIVSAPDQWWSLKQSRLHQAEGGSQQGTFDFALWNLAGSEPFVSYVFQQSGAGGQVPFELPKHGEPMRVGYYVSQNTPGLADGRVILWLNDRVVLDVHDAVLRTTTELPSGVSLLNNYSAGPLGEPSAPILRELDDALIIANPTLEPELLHQLALDAIR